MRAFLAVMLLASVGCGDASDTTEPVGDGPSNNGEAQEDEPAVTYHRDVAPLLEEKCNDCHRDGGIAPFTLTDYASVSALKMAISDSVHTRTMPPWLAGEDCTTYVNDPSLTADEIAMIDEWIDLGAPEGKAEDRPEVERQESGLSRVDLTIKMPEIYTPQFEPDDYRCFVMEWPEEETRYITGFRAIPGNDAMVHHVIGFLGTPENAQTFRDLDAQDPGPGYTCYGGAGARDANWLGSWAPGSNAGDFWPGTGIKVEPGSVVIMQLHYNTLADASSKEDLTAIDLKLDDTVEKEAFVMPFTNPAWLRAGGMKIAKDDPDATHKFSFDPSNYLGYISNGAIDNGEFTIYGIGIHMHALGTKGTIAIERGSDEPDDCMLDVPRWDFDWQLAYGFQQPKTFRPGDLLSLECHWDNTAGNQVYAHVDTDDDGIKDAYEQLEPGEVEWGEGTQDEMCLGIMYVTGK